MQASIAANAAQAHAISAAADLHERMNRLLWTDGMAVVVVAVKMQARMRTTDKAAYA